MWLIGNRIYPCWVVEIWHDKDTFQSCCPIGIINVLPFLNTWYIITCIINFSFCCKTAALRSEMLPFKTFSFFDKRNANTVNWSPCHLYYPSQCMTGLVRSSSSEQEQNSEPGAYTQGARGGLPHLCGSRVGTCISTNACPGTSGHLSKQLWHDCPLSLWGLLRACFFSVAYWLSKRTFSMCWVRWGDWPRALLFRVKHISWGPIEFFLLRQNMLFWRVSGFIFLCFLGRVNIWKQTGQNSIWHMVLNKSIWTREAVNIPLEGNALVLGLAHDEGCRPECMLDGPLGFWKPWSGEVMLDVRKLVLWTCPLSRAKPGLPRGSFCSLGGV